MTPVVEGDVVVLSGREVGTDGAGSSGGVIIGVTVEGKFSEVSFGLAWPASLVDADVGTGVLVVEETGC